MKKEKNYIVTTLKKVIIMIIHLFIEFTNLFLL